MTFGVAVVIVKNHNILLIQREDLGIWALPGGLVEEGETPELAAFREAKEETGLDIKLGKLFGIYIRTIPFFEDVLLVYCSSYQSGNLSLNTEVKAIKWFKIEDTENITKKLSKNDSSL